MTPKRLTLTALHGMPLIAPGDDLAGLITAALRDEAVDLADGDILVIAQKVVSKAEGRLVKLSTVQPSARARELAREVRKDPRLVELILSESTEVVRHRPDVLIVAHKLGFVVANAGVDQSNVGPDGTEWALLLPCAPDRSAAELKTRLDAAWGVDLGVIINDSFGRPWRNGVVSVALGSAGVPALRSLVGAPDLFGRALRVTEVATADQLASAASLLMGESDECVPVVHVRGAAFHAAPVPAAALVRSRETDLFR
jgi:coenzyme F420-0:L-glutamate ligase/coenzyme F420-1:gamma-L-glutamate ligase